MLKKSNKRRRTKAQIEEEKQEEVLKRQKLAADMAELVTLRLRVEAAEKKASMNESAAKVMGHMLDSGAVQQDSSNTVVLNTANGVQRFSLAGQEAEVHIDFDAGLEADSMEESDQKKE